MGELGLEMTDGDLCLLHRPLSAFSCHCLGSDSLPGGVQSVDAGIAVLLMTIAADDSDRHFAVTDESTPSTDGQAASRRDGPSSVRMTLLI